MRVRVFVCLTFVAIFFCQFFYKAFDVGTLLSELSFFAGIETPKHFSNEMHVASLIQIVAFIALAES